MARKNAGEKSDEFAAAIGAESRAIVHPSVYAALVAFQGECGDVVKEKKHQQGYKYADLEDWVDLAKPLLHKHGLALVVGFSEAAELGSYETAKGAVWHRVRVRATGALYHYTGDEAILFGAYGEGADPGDKATYKALTGARKYLLAAVCGSATTDDPEKEKRDQDEKPRAQPSAPRTEPGTPTVPPTTRAQGSAEKIDPAHAKDAWIVFKNRCKQVAPNFGDADVQLAFRGILFVVAGVTKTLEVPKAKTKALVDAVAGWLPVQAEAGDENEPPFDDQRGASQG